MRSLVYAELIDLMIRSFSVMQPRIVSGASIMRWLPALAGTPLPLVSLSPSILSITKLTRSIYFGQGLLLALLRQEPEMRLAVSTRKNSYASADLKFKA